MGKYISCLIDIFYPAGQKSYFRATAARIDVVQVGHVMVRIRDHPDKYLITLPSLQILGLWRGAPYVELRFVKKIYCLQ
jgi:hypothetical protein